MYSSYKTIGLVTTFLALATATLSVKSESQERLPRSAPQTSAPIQLNVTVTNDKRFVSELKQDNFQISVDKVPAKILHFSNEESPVSVGILFDASYSMGRVGTKKAAEKDLSIVQQAIARFIALSNDSNDYFLIGFNVKPQLLADWTSDATAIVDKLVGLRAAGNTALFDACYVAIEKLQHGRHPKRALLLISDGMDNSSHYTFEDLKKLIRETDVLLYSIDLQSAEDVGSALSEEGQAILSALTTTSGGISFRGKILRRQRDADEIFETIANELRNQYTIGIEHPVTSEKTKWHKIKLKVNPLPNAPSEMKNLSTRTREGFYSP